MMIEFSRRGSSWEGHVEESDEVTGVRGVPSPNVTSLKSIPLYIKPLQKC